MRLAAALAVAGAMVAAGCGASRDDRASQDDEAQAELVATTPAGKTNVDRITWAVYREPTSVDPIFVGDYPENTVATLLCESLFHQAPDGTIEPGLATGAEYTDPRTMVITLRDDVTFWDGSPMTAQDAAHSIERQRDPKLAGFWGAFLSSVDTIEATGPHEVTVTLKRPDYTLEGVLSFATGMVVKKEYAQAKGKEYGTVEGGAMCTGPYELGPWKTGDALSVVRNDDYWNGAEIEPKVRQIDFKGVPDEAPLTSGLLSGEIDGVYAEALSTLDQLRASDAVTVTNGPSVVVAAMIPKLDGVLGDERVRRALSMAIDRQGLVDTVYKGSAEPSRALGSPGSWSYSKEIFETAWNDLPELSGGIEEAKQLVEEAGAKGKRLVLATSNELSSIAPFANEVNRAARMIGLDSRLVSSSAANYINYFVDSKERAKIDGFFTTNWTNWPDPAALYATMGPGGVQNYYGYENAEVAKLLDEWRSSADPDERARKAVAAQKILTDELAWIPIVTPDTLLITSSGLTGAVSSQSYLFAPWANDLAGE